MPTETPTSVRIGPFTYSIGPLTAMDSTKHGLFGWHHWPSLEIKYREDTNIQQRAQIILHEVLHGIWYTGKIGGEDEDRDVEEEHVTQLAIGLCDFIRNNPTVVAWISQTLAGPGEATLHAVSEPPKTAAGMSDTELKALAAQKLVYVNDKPTLWA